MGLHQKMRPRSSNSLINSFPLSISFHSDEYIQIRMKTGKSETKLFVLLLPTDCSIDSHAHTPWDIPHSLPHTKIKLVLLVIATC